MWNKQQFLSWAADWATMSWASPDRIKQFDAKAAELYTKLVNDGEALSKYLRTKLADTH